MGARRATGHTRTSISVAVGKGCGETIGQRLKEGDDQIFLMIGQVKLAKGHIDRGRHFGRGLELGRLSERGEDAGRDEARQNE